MSKGATSGDREQQRRDNNASRRQSGLPLRPEDQDPEDRQAEPRQQPEPRQPEAEEQKGRS